jgi:hypothetical protein
LWIGPAVDGIWRGQRTEKGHRDKLFVWRDGYSPIAEPQGRLVIQGRRLDEGGRGFSVAGTNAYLCDQQPCGSTLAPGHWSLLAGVDIPTLGCWQLTASYGGDSLPFVVWVAP